MTYELWMLIGSVLVLFATIGVQAQALVITHGLATAAGNRDDIAAISDSIYGRSKRTAENNLYALAMFAPVVLTAKAAGISNDMTILGAQLFFFTRVAYSFIYVAGVPYIRSVIWAASMFGMAIVIYGLTLS